MNITGIVIPGDEQEPMRQVEFDTDDLKTMQGFVGGTLAVIDVDRPDSSLWCNDESKLLQGWTFNRRATLLLWMHATHFRNLDGLAGNVLLTGRPDGEGVTHSVPDELVNLLFRANTFKVEVQTQEDGPWATNDIWFSDWQSAYIYGLRLAERWTAVLHVRVIEHT